MSASTLHFISVTEALIGFCFLKEHGLAYVLKYLYDNLNATGYGCIYRIQRMGAQIRFLMIVCLLCALGLGL